MLNLYSVVESTTESRKEKDMKKEVILANKIGATLNSFLLMVNSNPVDPGYSDDVKNDRLRLSRPINIYSIERVRITSIKTEMNANNKVIVIFNENPDMWLPLSDITSIEEPFPKPTPNNIREAILKSKTDGQKTLFADYEALYKQVELLNNQSKQELENFLSKQMTFVNTFKEANKAERLACENALDEIGLTLK